MTTKVYRKNEDLICEDIMLSAFKISTTRFSVVRDVVLIVDNDTKTFLKKILLTDFRDVNDLPYTTNEDAFRYLTRVYTNAYGLLAQVTPLPTTLTNLYIVPQGKLVDKVALLVTNTGNTSTTFRVALVPTDVPVSSEDYRYYDVNIDANDTYHSYDLKLSQNNKVVVYAGNASVSFSINGEILDI